MPTSARNLLEHLQARLKQDVSHCSNRHLEGLTTLTGKQNSPIILIGHSYGGIVIKEAVYLAMTDDTFADIHDAIIGLVFLGTPHFGSDLAYPIARLAGLLGTLLGSSDLLLRSMTSEDAGLNSLHQRFSKACEGKSHKEKELDLWRDSSRFYEEKPTMLLGLLPLGRIVATNSALGGLEASRGAALMKDHSGLNKFVSSTDEAFLSICRAIEYHRSGARSRNYEQKSRSPGILRAARTVVATDGQQRQDQRISDADESTKFAVSTEFLDWKRVGASSDRSKHFLYVKSAHGESLSLDHAVYADLQRPGPGQYPFDLAYCSTSALVDKTMRASEVLRQVLAQVVLADQAHSDDSTDQGNLLGDRVRSLDANDRHALLRALEESQPQEQTKYWNLLCALIGSSVQRPIFLIVDRVDMIEEGDRREFLTEIMRVWDRRPDQDWLRVLLSSQPCSHELMENFLGSITVFDPHREFFIGMNTIRDIATNARQDQVGEGLPGTGHWIFEHDTYVTFSNTGLSGLICLMGNGGSGKSTLTKKILEAARLRYKAPAFRDMISATIVSKPETKRYNIDSSPPMMVVAAFFYQHDAHSEALNQHMNMLCSLLYQIFSQMPHLYWCWRESMNGKTHTQDWSFDDVQAVFQKLRDITDTQLNLHLFIDALNESHANKHDSQTSPTLRQILSLLNDLRTSGNKKVVWKIMISTRELSGDVTCIQPSNTIRVTEYNRHDVETIIEDAMRNIIDLQQSKQPSFSVDEIAKLEVELKANAKGVILWVEVVRDMVMGRLGNYGLRLFELQNFVRHSLDKMDLLYSKMVEDLKRSKQPPDMVKAWLQWGILAIGPLRVSEFKDAVALSDINATSSPTHEIFTQYRYEPNYAHAARHLIVSNCGGFLELRSATSSSTLSLGMKVQSLKWADHELFVEPTHHTATAFLMKEAAIPFQILKDESNRNMLTMCIKYLDLLSKHGSDPEDGDKSTAAVQYLEDLPFLPYVLMNLPRHLALDDQSNQTFTERIQENIRGLFRNKPSGRVIISLLRMWVSNLGRDRPDQCVWSSCSLEEVTAGDVELLNNFVMAAADLNAANALRSVLAAGLLSEEKLATVTVLKAVIISSVSSNDPRMRDVLSSISPKRHTDGHALRAAYRTSLHEALTRKISPAGIDNLIKSGADVHYRNESQSSPLHVTAASGDAEASDLLLRAGSEVDARDQLDQTPLLVAVSMKHEMIVKQLLDHGARVDATTTNGGTPMSLCRNMSGYEAESIRRLLVDHGAQMALPEASKRQGWMTIPIRPPKNFVQRSILGEIKQAIEFVSKLQHHLGIVAVCGLGGAGKTQLAAQAALDLHRASPGMSIFWIDGSSQAHIQSSCQYLVQLVGPSDFDPKQPPEDWLVYFLAWLANGGCEKWFLLVDNLDDKQLLVPFISQMTRGSMLVTSRDSSVAAVDFATDKRPEVITIGIGVLAKDEAIQMLLQRHKHPDNTELTSRAGPASDERQEVEELVTELGFLPLAIAQAGSFLTTTKMNVRDYLELLTGSHQSREQVLEQEFNERRGPHDLANAVLKTWEVSFQEIQRVSPLSVELLAMLGVLDPQGCPEYLLLTSADDGLEASHSMRILYQFSFLVGLKDAVVRTHPLVHEAIRRYLKQQQILSRWELQALRHVSTSFPKPASNMDRDKCTELFPHAEKVLEYALRLLPHSGDYLSLAQKDRDDWESWLSLLTAMARYQREANALRRAKSLVEEARRIANIMGLTDTERDLALQTDLAMVLARLGNLAQAEGLEYDVLRRLKEAPDTKHQFVTQSKKHLASVYQAAGKLREAENLFTEVLEAARTFETQEQSGCELSSTQTAMLDLADVYLAMGKHQEAEILQLQVNEVRVRQFGSQHPLTIRVRIQLAIFYGVTGRYEMAEEILMDVANQRNSQHDQTLENSIWSGTANLATLYRTRMRWAEAEELDRQLLAIVPQDHPLSLILKENLAVTLRERGVRMKIMPKLQEALELASNLVEAREDTLGADAPETLAALTLEAQVRWYLGESDVARGTLEKIYTSRTKAYGPEHPDALTTLSTIASLMSETQPERLEDVVRIQRSVLDSRSKVLGPHHPETVEAMDRLTASEKKLRRDGTYYDSGLGGQVISHLGSGHTYSSVQVRGNARSHYGDAYGGNYVTGWSINDSSEQSKLWIEATVDSTLCRDIRLRVANRGSTTDTWRRTRIAILDTGYCPGATFFESSRISRRIVGWRDFATDSTTGHDDNGHGTHALSCAMMIAPFADYFVARVAEHEENFSENVAKAIDWAVRECQCDIVSMSFGFSGIDVAARNSISRAINRAIYDRDERIVFLAAAGTSAGLDRKCFPASHDGVIAVRATDHLGILQDYNPSEDAEDADEIATLGANVRAAWPPPEHTRTLSGTAGATSIAAGIAALILDAARLTRHRANLDSEQHPFRNLGTKAGMRRMLCQSIGRKISSKLWYVNGREFSSLPGEKRERLMDYAV